MMFNIPCLVLCAIRVDGQAGGLLGSNLAGTVFLALLNVAPPGNSAQQPSRCVTLDLAGNLREIFNTAGFPGTLSLEGWIAPDGSVLNEVARD